MQKFTMALILTAAPLLPLAAPSVSRADPPPSLEGGWVIYWRDQAYGTQVIRDGDGYRIVNENQIEARMRPVAGNPYLMTVEGFADDCRWVTIIVSEKSISLLYSNHTEWIRPR